jgi:chitodextrinase
LKRKKAFSNVILVVSFLAFAMFMLANPVRAQTTKISVSSSEIVCHQLNQTFVVNLTVSDVSNLWSWKVGLTWDSEVLSPIGNPKEGTFLKATGSTIFLATPPREGCISEISCTLLKQAGASGSANLATITFQIRKEAIENPINLVNSTLLAPLDDQGQHPKILHEISNAKVTLILGSRTVANAGQDQTVNEGSAVMLNGSKSAPMQQNLSFAWSFSDDNLDVLNGVVAFHTFEKPGIYEVTLTITDALDSWTSNDTTVITVVDTTPPNAVIELEIADKSEYLSTETLMIFNGSKSYDPEGGRIKTYLWNFGDGSNASVATTSHRFSSPGTYTVHLTVTDERSSNQANATIMVVVGGINSQTLTLPPMVLGVLIFFTALIIPGSVIWLRKMKR